MSHILRKRGVRMPLQELPFRMLAMLLARPGEVVTREELKQELWSEEDFGEFDLGLNTAVKKLRQALDDSANTPRFIETIPKVGYKFLVPVAESPRPELTSVDSTDSTDQTVNPVEALPPGAVVVQQRSQRALQAVAAVATLALLGVSYAYFTAPAPEPPEKPVTRFSFAPEGLTKAHISPDGKSILYAAGTGQESSLWIRSLSDESARELPGTEGAVDGFWSPDSAWIGFATGAPDAELKRVSIDGGSPITLCELPGRRNFPGGTWSPDGERIVFSSGKQVYEIASRGGQPQLLFDATDDPRPVFSYYSPGFLPVGNGPAALVYTSATSPADYRMAVLNLETGERRDLGPGRRPVYSEDGYLIHAPTNGSDRGLWALPFSLDTLEPTGDAFPISTAGLAASVSHDGTLAYRDDAATGMIRSLVWRSRPGEFLEAVGQPQPGIGQVALSPDGPPWRRTRAGPGTFGSTT